MNNIGDGYLKNYVQGYEMSLFFQSYILLGIHLIKVYWFFFKKIGLKIPYLYLVGILDKWYTCTTLVGTNSIISKHYKYPMLTLNQGLLAQI
jgi:hypothetical protein